ncbi:Putative N-acetylmuramidase [Paucilactobacillus oligofermentans DSM 15707 = LMG 22743]|nr:glycoside hydrolase family 73 protein [Paucilactobacillus oligofermentans]CUS25968.1 Putative N-acetylmuramidase [Paucilactobacillus oligofermentans DSM 15707 = LMG 22743]
MKYRKILLVMVIIISIINITSQLVYASSETKDEVTSAVSEASQIESSTASFTNQLIHEQVIDDIMDGHLSKLDDFKSKQDYQLYMDGYNQLKNEYQKGMKNGRINGYKNKIKNVSKQSEIFQVGYQKGFQLTNEIYQLEHDESKSISSSESRHTNQTESSQPFNETKEDQPTGIVSFSNQSREEENVEPLKEIKTTEDSVPVITLPPLPLGPMIPSHQAFIELIAVDAVSIAQKNDLYASVMIAQAALESSWGTSDLARPHVYNLFGVKGGYKGKSIQMKTQEDDGFGNLSYINDDFRQYNSYFESLNDYAEVMNQPLFSAAKRGLCGDYHEVTRKLTGTYATDTQYDRKLNQIIETYQLDKYDRQAVCSKVKPIALPRLKLQYAPVKNRQSKVINHKSKTEPSTIYVVMIIIIIIGVIIMVLKKPTVRK